MGNLDIKDQLLALIKQGLSFDVSEDKLLIKGNMKALTEESRDFIKRNKQSIIQLILQRKSAKKPAIVVRDPAQPNLLSFAQQRLWLLDQIEGGSAPYNIPGALRLNGNLDVRALNQAFTSILERHESLRTCFVASEDGQPTQVVQLLTPFEASVTDLSALEEGDRQLKLASLVADESARAFNLGCDLMLRAHLVKLAKEEHVVLVTMHHIASDGWSMSLLINEFCKLYTAYAQGQENPLTPLSIQYADYAHWQRKWLQGGVLNQQLAYWEKQLADSPVVHGLPLDHMRPTIQSFSGDTHRTRIDTTTSEALMQLCQAQGASLFMGLQAAFSVLLARYSNETDIVVGSPIANREQEEVSSLIGFFVNTLVLRSNLSGNPSFSDLIQQSKEMLLNAYAHQQVPFEKLVERLQPERSQSHSPLFQVMLVLENNEAAHLELPGLMLSPVESNSGVARYDLTLTVIEGPQGLQLAWEYNTDLFEQETIARMAVHFNGLLKNLVSQPEQSVFKAKMINEQERNQLLMTGKCATEDYPKDLCAHELFERTASDYHDTVAVVYDDKTLTYGELNQRANQLAHFLIEEKQVKPDCLVGICIERSVDMVVGILAILKAGGAYVPLDPGYPEARLEHMLNDAGLTTVITRSDLVLTTPVKDVHAVCLDSEKLKHQLSNQSKENPCVQKRGLTPSHAAYVIYTSGSTGIPKGVTVIHSGVVNYLSYVSRCYFTSVVGAVASSPLAFDATVTSLLGPLVAGKRLELIPQDGRELECLAEHLLNSEAATLFKITPAHMEGLAHYLSHVTVPDLPHWFVIGGDQLSSKIAREWKLKVLPRATLVNEYGPTETVVGCSTFFVTDTKPMDRERPAVPIGKPIDNTSLLVLDTAKEIVPVGVAGELYIGGAGLARGYLNQPNLSAEKFVHNPFHKTGDPSSSERLYKTGDLVRWLPEGNLEFLGRIDHQVKIRGFRIELGEIEETLHKHDDVTEAVVLARDEEHSGDKLLVAYVVAVEIEPSNEEGTGAAQQKLIERLRHHLQKSLPEYMVPSAFVFLERLPLTNNGKINRNALPDPIRSIQQNTYVAPRTETDKVLCEAWQDLLNIEKVGITDNFFQLGGHSLLVMQLIARLRKNGLRLTARQIFSTPRLVDLADALDGASTQSKNQFKAPENLIPPDCEHITSNMLSMVSLTEEEIAKISATVPGNAANIQDIYPLAPLQEGILFHHMMNPEKDPYVMQALFRVSGEDAVHEFISALQFIVNRHDVLRTAIVWRELSTPVQVVCRQVNLPVSWLDLHDSVDLEAELRARCINETQQMDLRKAPLLQLQIAADVHSGQHYIQLQYHHIISDHVGLEIIEKELSLYRSGQVQQLPTPVSYREFVAHTQHQSAHQNQEAFFASMLGDVEEPTLPFNLVDVAGDGSRIVEACAQVPAEISESIRRATKALAMSPAVLFHSAWAMVLANCSGRDDVVFGTVFSGRLQGAVDAENMLGVFINTLPIRIKLHKVTATELLQQVHQLLTELLPYEQASLTLAQNASAVPAGSPLFSAMLNYRHSVETAQVDTADNSMHQAANNGFEFLYDQERTNYPVTVSVDDLGQGFGLEVQVDSAVSAEKVLSYMQTALRELVSALESASSQVINALPIMPKVEQCQLREWGNGVVKEYPVNRCIHELFEMQANSSPDSVAVIFEDSQLTYAELNQKANQLAHFLIAEKGVGPDTLVGICMERSLEMVVSILAILKAGGAYVPLDPEYPNARLAYMLEDAKLSTVLMQNHLISTVVVSDDQVVCLDDREIQDRLSQYQLSNPDAQSLGLNSNHLAYVIYTSGSTGKPKGVMVEHQSLVNRIDWMNQEYGSSPSDRVLQKTPFSFDVSVWEFVWPLTVGAGLVLAKPGGHKDPAYLTTLIQKEYVTKLHFVPSMLGSMLAMGDLPECASLQQIFCSGETLPLHYVEQFQAKCPWAKLHNLYGPTEAAIDVSYWDCSHSYKNLNSIPIGKPIQNIQLFVLDKQLNPVPTYVPGELHIGGVGLARGYLNRAELTNDKFIENPFENKTNPHSRERLYATGDLVRWLPNGNLEFLGRIDHQVKIRGFRIELGEIENTFNAHESISESIVLAKDTAIEDKRLVAYLVTDVVDINDESEMSVAAQQQFIENLRQHASQTLPDYMVPSAFVLLAQLPLTANGKVDRNALPEPDISSQQEAYVEPSSESEKVLCEIWKEVLGLERVGVTDNFFKLGGHSLLAVRLASQIEKIFGKSLPIRTILVAPTVAEQVAQLQESNGGVVSFEELEPDFDNRYQPFPLTEIQQAYWLGRTAGFEIGNISTHAYIEEPIHNVNLSKLQWTLNRLIERHDMLRMVVTEDGEQKILESVPEYELECYELSELPDNEAEEQVLSLRNELSHQVLSTDRWPLFDIRLSLLSNQRAILHISIDVMLIDASSMRILKEDCMELYFNAGARLHPLSLSFRDYVLAERDLESSDLYRQSKDYWLRRVPDFPQRPALPLAVDPAGIETPRFERRHGILKQPQWTRLKELAQKHQITPTVLLLGCMGDIINQWSQNPHFALNLTMFNRLPVHPEVNSVVGDFTSLTLLEMDYRNGHSTFVDRLKMLQNQLWEDMEHRYFGGIAMQRALRNDSGSTTGFPVVFTSTLGLPVTEDEPTSPTENVEESMPAKAVSQPLDHLMEGFVITQTSQTWLDIQASESEGDLHCNWDSVVDLFPEGQLDDMFSSFWALLEKLSESEERWSEQTLIQLNPQTREAVTAANTTVLPFQPDLLHAPLLAQVDRQGDKTAVRMADYKLSYARLGDWSELLASQLVAGGAKPNQLVAVVMEKGWEQVVAVLGIVRSGAAYLPIDASQPKERILQLLTLGEVTQVVTTPTFLGLLPQNVDCYVVDKAHIDDTTPRAEAGLLQQEAATPSDMAYVIFTSGSSGEPKGVTISHESALNTVLTINNDYSVSEKDSVFGLSNLNFDLSVYDIFGVLGAGGTLVLPKAEEYRNPAAWLSYLTPEGSKTEEDVTLWNTVPALMQLLVEESEDRSVTLPLRLVMMSGDWIPVDLPRRIREVAPLAEQKSLGGATEVSIWSIHYPISEVNLDWSSVPYGKALANQQVYVLKNDLSFAPTWVTGDLYIGGVGLAIGYWRDAEKTKASFIVHPVTGERLYKTGDLGRLLPDGNIEFKGRIDNQVKIRGYRIELGEIEAVINQHISVKDVLVSLVSSTGNSSPGTGTGIQNLVAYVVFAEDAVLDAEEIAQFVESRLPEYMVPKMVIPLQEMPLTSNGKVDRKSLPIPDMAEIMEQHYVPATTDTEMKICEIWQDVLGIERVGIADNFFLLGGDSLTATRVVAKVNSAFGVDLEFINFFTQPTVENIASYISALELNDRNSTELEDTDCIEEGSF